MSKGYFGKILRVDLTRERISIDFPDDLIYKRYLGGEGLIAYYLLTELQPRIDPLSMKNILIFATGPVTGVTLSGASRSCVGAKSPLTGGFGEAEVGGFWGTELKRTGYDAIIFTGKAQRPVYLLVTDELAEIRDAKHLWGKTTGETQETIEAELGDEKVRIASIGPGGENLVRYACIMHDLRHAAGRTGMGAVMGSKNLKAVVAHGKLSIPVADEESLAELRKKMNKEYLKDLEHFSLLGTGGDRMESFVTSGNLSVKNFHEGIFPTITKIDPRIIKETIGLEMEGCYACPIRCKKVVHFSEPWEVKAKYGGPEYESLGAFGSNCGIDDVKAICKANELCNRYSLDVISTGVTIGFIMECFEKKILTKEQTDGLELNFGNAEILIQVIEKIAKRDGIGNLLAQGVKRIAEELGKKTKVFAMHVKGLEIPMHEPRLKRGLGLGYALSPTGADHMHNLNDQTLTNTTTIENYYPLGIYETIPLEDLGPRKVRALIYQTNWRIVYNCLLMCMFQPWKHMDIVNLTRAITGRNISMWELMKVGERVTTMARVFNIREGLSSKDDILPERFFEPTTSGALSKATISHKQFIRARELYYKIMGWTETGIPTKEKLYELDIPWVIDYLPDD
ncbi:MAG: aldehyde ferredoxin oxidoreductase family protein [Candidatus Heimdallarchaeota archaeon]|nr:aldehyde ferredoxin oxidoreductase family protein [Candidatus Heimdallarchaeota archaeon]